MNFQKLTPFFVAVLVLSALIFFAWNRMDSEKVAPVEEATSELRSLSSAGLQELIQSSEGKVIVVNFWATFCGPCREEFPYFLSAYKEYKDEGLELIFVSMDFDSDRPQIDEFLNEQGVNFTTYLREGKDDDFIRSVHPDWSGVLPTTLIYGADKKLIHFLPKALSFEELEDLIVGILNPEKRTQQSNENQEKAK